MLSPSCADEGSSSKKAKVRFRLQTSELRAAIDVDGIAGDPPGIFGCQEGDNATDVVGLRNALERLHPKDELASGVRLGEVRHVRLDDARCHGIDADTARAKQRGEMLHQ